MKNIRIVIFLLLLLIATLLSLIGRCFYLQYLKKQHYSSLTLNQQPQKPQRGTILDRQGRVLAASNKVQIVFAEPRTIDNHRETAAKLAPLLAMNEDEIYLLITKSKNPGFAKIKVGADAASVRQSAKSTV